jgi:hypothetical protein
MLDSKFELTHCLIFEIPENSDKSQIWNFVSKKLNKINFHGGTISINLPSEDISFKLKKRSLPNLKNLIRKGDSKKVSETGNLTGTISQNVVRESWAQRINILKESVRFQIKNFSLPYLEDIYEEECRLYLHIGEQKCRLTLAQNQQILDHQQIDFSLEKMVQNSDEDLTDSKKAFNLLRSAQIQFKRKKCLWQTKHSIEKMDELFETVEDNLKSFSEKLLTVLEKYEKTFSIESPKVRIVGAGGLYPWIKTYLKNELDLTFQNIKPFSKLNKAEDNFNSKKLEEVEPVFAEAVALAISGCASNRKSLQVTNKINWTFDKEWFFKSKFRLVSLTSALAALLLYLIFAFQIDQKYQEFQTLDLHFQDLEQQIDAFNRRVSLDSLLAEPKAQNNLWSEIPRFSNILKLIGEEIPSGNWVTNLSLISASEIKEFRTKNKKKKNLDLAVVVEGKAISSNFISDFYNKLNDSGCFTKVLIKRSEEKGVYIDSIPYIIYAKISGHNE